jgi:hypothetical protein
VKKPVIFKIIGAQLGDKKEYLWFSSAKDTDDTF